MVDARNDEARNFVVIAGEDPSDKQHYPLTVDPVTGALLTSGGGVSPPVAPSSLISGTIIGTGAAQQLNVTSVVLEDGVLVQNNVYNTGDMWVGHDATVAVDNGVLATPGEGVPVAINDLNKIWILMVIAAEKCNYIGS